MSWRDGALCAETDPDAFFPEHGGFVHATEAAKKLCMGCPVRSQCLEEAVRDGIEDGIWGGLTPSQRKHLARKRAAAA